MERTRFLGLGFLIVFCGRLTSSLSSSDIDITDEACCGCDLADLDGDRLTTDSAALESESVMEMGVWGNASGGVKVDGEPKNRGVFLRFLGGDPDGDVD